MWHGLDWKRKMYLNPVKTKAIKWSRMTAEKSENNENENKEMIV